MRIACCSCGACGAVAPAVNCEIQKPVRQMSRGSPLWEHRNSRQVAEIQVAQLTNTLSGVRAPYMIGVM